MRSHYSIKEDTGARGWVPAWFVGKLPNEPHAALGATPTPSPGAPPDISPSKDEDK
jgi:bZIP factor